MFACLKLSSPSIFFKPLAVPCLGSRIIVIYHCINGKGRPWSFYEVDGFLLNNRSSGTIAPLLPRCSHSGSRHQYCGCFFEATKSFSHPNWRNKPFFCRKEPYLSQSFLGKINFRLEAGNGGRIGKPSSRKNTQNGQAEAGQENRIRNNRDKVKPLFLFFEGAKKICFFSR